MKYPQAWFFFLTSSRRPGSLQTRNVHALLYSPENTGVEYAPLDVPPSELNEDLISIPLTPQKGTGLHSLPGGRPLHTERRGPFSGRITPVIRLLQGLVLASRRAWEPPFVKRVP